LSKFIIVLVVVSLTANIFPVLNVTAILALLAIYVVQGRNQPHDPELSPQKARRFLVCAYVFWVTSYLLTGAPLSNFFSYDFLRFDGALLIAYLPLLILVNYSLDARFVEWVLGLFLSLLSAIAMVGALEFADALGAPLGLSSLPDELQMVHLAPSPPQYVFHGLFRAHNACGAIYAIAACMGLALLLRADNVKVLSWPTFWFAASFTGLTLSKSRTAYIAFLVTGLFMLLSARTRARKILKVVVVVVLPLSALLLAQPEVNQRVEAVTSTADPNVLGRFLYYERALEDISLSPVIGIGFGRYNDYSQVYSGIPNFAYIATGGEIVNSDEHSHNSYLHFLAEGGVIGFGLMMGIWISAYRWAGRMRKRFSEFTLGYALACGVQGCVLLEFGLSFTEHSMGTGVSSLTVFTLVGLLRNLAACEQQAPVPVFAGLQPAT
jgi:O-antigen ligase